MKILRALSGFSLLVVLVPASIAADPVVSLKWTGTTGSGSTGGSAITVSDTAVETLTLEMSIALGDVPVSTIFTSLQFDVDLDDELDIVSYEKLSWTNQAKTKSMSPLTKGLASSQESSTTKAGKLFSFENATMGVGIKNKSWAFARIVFETNPANVENDGDDVASGSFAPNETTPDDGIFGTDDEDTTVRIDSSVSFGTAAVNK